MENRIDKFFFDASIYSINFVANNKLFTRTVALPFDMMTEKYEKIYFKKYFKTIFNNEVDVKSVDWLCDIWCPIEYFKPDFNYIDQ